jgi:hypothetical protein
MSRCRGHLFDYVSEHTIEDKTSCKQTAEADALTEAGVEIAYDDDHLVYYECNNVYILRERHTPITSGQPEAN